MREKNSRKEHISFSQVQENLFAGQRSGGESQARKKKTTYLKQENNTQKTLSEDTYTGYLTATLRWLCKGTQLFHKLSGGADLK